MTELHFLQSYGPEHLLTFSNLRLAGLLTEQAPGDTLTAVESKVSKLVTDKAAGEQGAQGTPSLARVLSPRSSQSSLGGRERAGEGGCDPSLFLALLLRLLAGARSLY